MRPVQPKYRVKHSARAKHVRLKVTPFDGVIVVVPTGFDERQLPELLERQQPWIERQLTRISAALGPVERRAALPASIALRACDERWQIAYEATTSTRILIAETGPTELRVHGAIDDHGRVRAALKRWLARRARATLVGRLDALSARYRLPYEKATIRFQRSRWGSCSSRGTISLNAQLMFLPPDQVRCVLTHELCHTAHLNHGPDFRALLDRLEPDHQALHRELRQGWARVPAWVFS